MVSHNHNGVYAAIAGSLILSLLGTYIMTFHQQVVQMGGYENYREYRKIVSDPKYAENIKQSLDAQKEAISGSNDTGDTNNTQPVEQPVAQNISASDLTAITQDAYVKWNENADILWVEYSDLECPFCKRLHDSGAITNLEAKYGDQIAFVFKHYPLPFHPTALPAAEAAECVGQAGGSDKYYAFINAVFAAGTPTQAVVDAAVTSVGLDPAKIKTCADANTFKTKIDAHTTEGSSKFGVNGTPGNVLINTKTGKYEVVSGAQPEANFDAAIQRLLAE